MSSNIRTLSCALIGGMLAGLRAPVVSAQDLGRLTDRTFYVTLVSGGDSVGNRAIVIIRRQLMLPHDIILVDLNRATSRDLESALVLMERLKVQQGDSVHMDFRAAPSKPLGRPFRDGEQQRLHRYLAQLNGAPVQNVSGIGFAHVLDLTVPRQAFADQLERPSGNP